MRFCVNILLFSLIYLQYVGLHQKPSDDKPVSVDGSGDSGDDTYDANDDDDVKWLEKCAYPPHSKGKSPTFSGKHDNTKTVDDRYF